MRCACPKLPKLRGKVILVSIVHFHECENRLNRRLAYAMPTSRDRVSLCQITVVIHCICINDTARKKEKWQYFRQKKV